jgi:hypothetical protein
MLALSKTQHPSPSLAPASAASVPTVPALTTSSLETSQIANAPPRTDSAPSGADLRAAAERQRQLEKEGTVHRLVV